MEDIKIEKKYGLWVAIALVIGIVIGSGIFFKTDDIIKESGGNLLIGLIALALGAVAMIFGSMVFGEYAQKVEKAGGVVDYIEYAYGKKAAHLIGWFQSILYFPSMTAVLSWVSARYFLGLFNISDPVNGSLTWILALVFLLVFYVINYLAPIIAGKVQVSTTVIKLIPLILVGVIGIIAGLANGTLVDNYSATINVVSNSKPMSALFKATVLTSFAYEGWIVATQVNLEIKDSKKTLPLALLFGTLIVAAIYVIFYMGVTAYVPLENIDDNSVKYVVNNIFNSRFMGTFVMVLVVISCVGTLNGLVLGSIRTPYSLAVRGNGIKPNLIAKVSEKTKMPLYSAIYSLAFTLLSLVVWYGSFNGWYKFLEKPFGTNFIDISTFPICFCYLFYVALHIYTMIKFKDLSIVRRYVVPVLAILGGSAILYGGFVNMEVMPGLLFSFVACAAGLFFYRKSE